MNKKKQYSQKNREDLQFIANQYNIKIDQASDEVGVFNRTCFCRND